MTSNFYDPDRPTDPSYNQPHLKGHPQIKAILEKSGGTKYDSDRVRMDLLDPWALEGLAAVLTFGARKYDAHNWRRGITNSRLVASLERHLGAIKKGEYIDGESGLHHIDHLGCNWMFLSYNFKRRTDMNDLWVPDGTE